MSLVNAQTGRPATAAEFAQATRRALDALDRINADNNALRARLEEPDNTCAKNIERLLFAAAPTHGSLEEVYARAAGQACRSTHEALEDGETLAEAVEIGVTNFRNVIENALDIRRDRAPG